MADTVKVTFQTLRLRRIHLLEHMMPYEWHTARHLKKLGVKTYMQWVLFPYIVDFLMCDRPLIIEIDGNVHDAREEYDDRRSAYLERHGFQVFRLSNEDVNFNNIREIVNQVPYTGEGYIQDLIYKVNAPHSGVQRLF